MKSTDILELIGNGESSAVEFKTDEVHSMALAEEIVAFANFDGGMILIGVTDDGAISGCRRSDIEPFVVNVCRNNVRPSILPYIEKIVIDGKKILVVRIAAGSTPHATSAGRYFIRIGSTNQVPNQQELLRLFQKRNILQFDETPVLKAGIEDINKEKVDAYLDRIGQSLLNQDSSKTLAQDLSNLSVVMNIEGQECPTLAGILAFGRQPQRFFPSYTVVCGAYRGSSLLSETVSEKTLTGTLDVLVEDTMSFLRLVIPQDPQREGPRRRDAFKYPIDALREAVVNAICHRDYTISGSGIRVFVFDDHLEIRSPGGLPNTLTLESMVYRQFARNQVIASFLAGMGYMEKRGKGVLRIKRQCQEAAVACQFELTPDNSELVLTMSA